MRELGFPQRMFLCRDWTWEFSSKGTSTSLAWAEGVVEATDSSRSVSSGVIGMGKRNRFKKHLVQIKLDWNIREIKH